MVERLNAGLTGQIRHTVRRSAPLWVLCATLLLAGTTGGATEGTADRVVPRVDDTLREYRALRRMHARCDRLNQEAWLDAWTELDASGFRYEIVGERGTESIRNRVLRGVLKREQELAAEGASGRAALTHANYVFSDPSAGADGLQYVLLKPRRKDVVLVDGRMVLSPDGTELLRVEGRLAKNPSFWTSLVHIVRHFAMIDGVRVPVSTESTAKVKFAGHSTLEARYEYESINGRPVSQEARRQLASAAAAPAR